MHPSKVEALEKLATSSRDLDTEIDKLRQVVQNPQRDGWGNSFKALVTLPFLGLGAVVVDATEVLVRRIHDELWDDRRD